MIEAAIRLTRGGFDLDVAFSAGAGVTALFGPSGSGKTTILNAIAGLERPQQGQIAVEGKVFFDSQKQVDLPPQRRHIGYVFQDALLFPHLSVAQNLRYGMNRQSGGFDKIVALLGLESLLERRPAKLSGGERQRAAIARALLSEPRVLLMDEPLASLDIERKHDILPYVENLRDSLGMPILYVSHSVEEVARLADRVIVIDQGKVIAAGPPETALAPRLSVGETRFDRISVLTGRAGPYDLAYGLTPLIQEAGRITIAGKLEENRETRIVIRATDVTLATAAPRNLSVRTALKGSIAAIERDAGPAAVVTVALKGGQKVAAAATRKAIDEMKLAVGTEVWCLIKAVSIDARWLPSG
ncbi:MAG TPA: molybdenum ABC transporter ATP-binding protein [Aestuariivirga sp.]|nr:molybdenum ABC transporter ATP-binding protein [Aestuariivirga sp.]